MYGSAAKRYVAQHGEITFRRNVGYEGSHSGGRAQVTHFRDRSRWCNGAPQACQSDRSNDRGARPSPEAREPSTGA